MRGWQLVVRIAVVLLAILTLSRPARAESTLVVLGRPFGGAPNAMEQFNRARGELLADGFRVLLLDAIDEGGREAALLREGRAVGAPVVAGMFLTDDGGSIELWLVDTVSARVVVRRLQSEPGESGEPEVLARRSVDLLRASLLDFLVDSLRVVASTSPPRASPSPAGTSVAPSVDRWALEGGLGILASFDGLGPAVLPVVRVRFAPAPPIRLRVTGAWLGTQPSVRAPTGSATVEQGLALAECAARPWRGPIAPFLSIGVGAYYAGVNGDANRASPYQGTRSSAVAFTAEAGIGVSALVASRLEMVLEAEGLVSDPGIAIRFLEVDAARIGRPSLLGTMTLAGWL